MTAPARGVRGQVFSLFPGIRRFTPPGPGGGRALRRPVAGLAEALALFSETGSADPADSLLGGLERN